MPLYRCATTPVLHALPAFGRRRCSTNPCLRCPCPTNTLIASCSSHVPLPPLRGSFATTAVAWCRQRVGQRMLRLTVWRGLGRWWPPLQVRCPRGHNGPGPQHTRLWYTAHAPAVRSHTCKSGSPTGQVVISKGSLVAPKQHLRHQRACLNTLQLQSCDWACLVPGWHCAQA